MLFFTLLWSLWSVFPTTPHPTDLPSDETDNFQHGVYRAGNGQILFESNAPLEVISARSARLRGAIDPATNSFAWTVEIKSFDGFNSPLQREHFNETYLESRKFPKATFTGKIIEKIDFQKDGNYNIRAKGKLSIHGVEQERIIKSLLEIKGGTIHIRTTFTVPLNDHNISVPKIVHQKIAEEVAITVESNLSSIK